MKEKTKLWWKAAAVRAVKTVAQTAVATIGTAAMLDEVNWLMVGGRPAGRRAVPADQRGRFA